MAGPFLRLPLFEGPLDLLLHLARRDAVPLRELPLAEVTAQFLAYIDVMRALEIEVCGEFVETASLLCLLKSRELLPRAEVDDDEEEVEDPREALVTRLVEYASFRQAAQELDARPRLGRDFFVRANPSAESAEHAAGRALEVDLIDVLGALRDLLERNRRDEPLHAAPGAVESVEDRMEAILALLVGRAGVGLDDLLGDRRDRPAVVTAFLAMLELVRRGWVGLVKGADELRIDRRFEGAPPAVRGLA